MAALHLQQQRQQRRRGLQHGAAVAFDQSRQRFRVAMLAIVGNDDAAAAQQRQIQLQRGDVERQRGRRA
jgi:hypothetical protein